MGGKNRGGKGKAKGRLGEVDLTRRMDAGTYERRLAKLQRKLAIVQQAYLCNGVAAVLVFEGWDAAGKGGTIRRISSALDPRSFKVWPIGAPRQYYLERHHLARFVERLPPRGAISVFDRSWYGRVLVERVEGLTPERRWRAAYREINDFERLLLDDDMRVVKLFFHISQDEQLRRFERRLLDPMKRWKLSYEDFRNRARWSDYEDAIEDMLEKTSPRAAPWKVIAANDKKSARIEAMEWIVEKLSKGVDLSPPRLDRSVLAEAERHFDLEPSLLDGLRGRME